MNEFYSIIAFVAGVFVIGLIVYSDWWGKNAPEAKRKQAAWLKKRGTYASYSISGLEERKGKGYGEK